MVLDNHKRPGQNSSENVLGNFISLSWEKTGHENDIFDVIFSCPANLTSFWGLLFFVKVGLSVIYSYEIVFGILEFANSWKNARTYEWQFF